MPDKDSITFRTAFWDGMIFNNLTLVEFVGLTPIVAGGGTVAGGLILSAATILVLVAVTFFASLLGDRMSERIRPAVCTLLAAALLVPAAMLFNLIAPRDMMAVGIVFPLVAVNGITLNRVRAFAGHTPLVAVGDALGKGLGFAIVMFFCSVLREILGYGTFCHIAVPFFADHCSPIIAGVPGGLFFLAVLARQIKAISFRRQKRAAARKEEPHVAVK